MIPRFRIIPLLLAATALSSVAAADRPERTDRPDRSERRRGSSTSASSAPAAASSSSNSGANSAGPTGSAFDAFQLVVERNIFNPTRVGRTRASEDKPARVDEIALVGTMNYDRGLVAFFESADASYKAARREGESIADFKVQRIMPEGVELLRGDKPVSVRVAQQLRRVEGGDWVVMATPLPTGPSGSSAPVAEMARPADNAGAADDAAEASEVLKRLLKKREKQFKQ